MKIQIPQTDIELFNKLEALYHALTVSVVDPICIPNPNITKNEKSIFSSMFYYAEDMGEEIVKRRIILAESDIRYVAKMHDENICLFYEIETTKDGRHKISKLVSKLSNNLFNYTNLVKEHQEKLGVHSFLNYPSCVLGHYGYRGKTISSLSFNPKQTEIGILEEISLINEMNEDFRNEIKPLSLSEILSTSHESLLTPFDGSYRGNLDLLKYKLKEDFNFVINL